MQRDYSRNRGHYGSSTGSHSSGSFNRHSPQRGGQFSRMGGGRGRPGGATRGGPKGEYINPARFVNRAEVVIDEAPYKPTNNFVDFKVSDRVKTAIVKKGYTTPTPIQDQSIPHILLGKDIVGIANTGTGKTGAFLIPLIDKVLHQPREKVLVIVPTRELALQIESELKSLTIGMGMYSVCCVGGMSIGNQISGLRNRYNFIIGTPGRLKDLIDRHMIRLSEFNTVVLDEADRMLDMGFVNDMRFVMAGMAKNRHTLFFSATLSSDIERLIGEFLREPVRVSVKTRDTSKNVDQDVVRLKQGEDKIEVLHALLKQKEFSKVLVFGRTKHGVEKLSKKLIQKGLRAESIHGNKTHGARQKALGLFKQSHIQVLCATDVAARGLDIPDVSHVINFDLPATHDDYVHRIGRTGRGDKKGKALTFVE